VNPQLEYLVRLQAIDSGLLEKTRELGEIPERLARTERVLDTARAAEEEFNGRLAALEKKKREREQDLQEAENRIRTLKERLSEVKTNAEYQARLKEIEAAKQKVGGIEEEILSIMEEIEALEPDRAEVARQREEANRLWQETRARVEERGRELEAAIEDLRGRREETVGRIEEEWYRSYRSLMKSRHGLAVAEIRDEICHGCNMSVPPQLYNEIRSRDEIFTCPTCQRILYYRDD